MSRIYHFEKKILIFSTPSALFLASLSLSMVATQTLPSNDTKCDQGWVYSDGFCYFFSEAEDSRSLSEAAEQCFSLDATVLRPVTIKEIEFLQTEAKKHNVYAWMLNLIRDYKYPSFFRKTLFHKYFNPLTNGIMTLRYAPKINYTWASETTNGTEKCVSFHETASFYKENKDASDTLDIAISAEACYLRLRIVCQGKELDFANQVIDNKKWFKKFHMVFWVSDILADRDKAKMMCKSKNMELLTKMDLLIQSYNEMSESTPWWTGFILKPNGLQMDDGTIVDATALDLSWFSGYNKDSALAILHHSGDFRCDGREFSLEKAKLPYICKKRSGESLYGCPSLWYRGGRSCYFTYKRESWKNAKDICERQNAHLVTVNTQGERLWIENVLRKISLSPNIFWWTSANDLKKEGTFTWHDNSQMSNAVLPWNTRPFVSQKYSHFEDCVIYDTSSNKISTKTCFAHHGVRPTCEYSLPDKEATCIDDSVELNGICYYMKCCEMIRYDEIPTFCASKLRGINASDIHAIQIKTKEILYTIRQFAQKQNMYYYGFYIGMRKSDAFYQWEWEDSTKVDFSVFDMKEPDNGNGGNPENCVAIDSSAYAFDEVCSRTLPFICERELPQNPDSSLIDPATDSKDGLGVMAFVPYFFCFMSLIVVHSIRCHVQLLHIFF